MAVLLTPARWLQIPGVSVGPEVVTFRVPVEMEPDPITLDLTGTDREGRGEMSASRRAAGGLRVHGAHTSATVRTQKSDG